jgi:hypothetical protein
MVPKVLSWLLTTVLLTTAPSADAQQSKKIYRIGYLSAGDAKSDSERSEAFRLALGKLVTSTARTSLSNSAIQERSLLNLR